MKRLLSTILALTLLCSMSIPAFAAEGEMSDPPMSDNSVQTDVKQEPDQPAARPAEEADSPGENEEKNQ